VATAVTQPPDPVASELRNLATRLTPADGPAASPLADGLNRIADLPSRQRPQAASALLAEAGRWYRDGQLSPASYARSVTALIDAGAEPSPPPATPVPSPRSSKGHKHDAGSGD
jgi:hypothetical protein